jgi:pimeloyl-ACP methyl ester carboxylesterase
MLAACASVGVEQRRVRAAGVVTAYFVEGAGPVIVLLPSASRDAHDLAELSQLLAREGFRTLRPQPRAVGGADVTLHDLAADVAAVVCAEGAPAIIAGHGYGNWVARVTAVDHPRLVRAVVLIAPARKGPPPPQLLEAIAIAADAGQSETRRLEALRLAFFAEGNDARSYLRGWRPDLRELQRRAAAATPQSGWWDAGRAPILEIQAADDPFMPRAYADELRGELGARVTTIVIERASHAVVAEQPAEVAEAIAGYVRTLGTPGEEPLTCR